MCFVCFLSVCLYFYVLFFVFFFFFFIFLYVCFFFFFFFFQAEDGIRDRTVTGVQTCALPILRSSGSPGCSRSWACASCGSPAASPCCGRISRTSLAISRRFPASKTSPLRQIGRASCRERV